jgi:hypothetical protein
MFDFYQDYEDSSYQLYLPEGAAVPDKAAAGRTRMQQSHRMPQRLQFAGPMVR